MYGTPGQQTDPKKIPITVPAFSASLTVLLFEMTRPSDSNTIEEPEPISYEFVSSCADLLAADTKPVTINPHIATGKISDTPSMQNASTVEIFVRFLLWLLFA